MNSVNRINQINQQELENNVSDAASWHMDFRDSNYIYIGGLNPKLKEKDLIIIFSQFGLPTHIKMIKDEEKKENKGFAYMKYSDFRLCVLAIDNLNGVVVYDKTIRVDHCWFSLRDDESEDTYLIDYEELVPRMKQIESKERQPTHIYTEKAHKEIEEQKIIAEVQDDEFRDPMADFLKVSDSSSKKRHSSDHRGSDKRHSSHRHRHRHRHREGKDKETHRESKDSHSKDTS